MSLAFGLVTVFAGLTVLRRVFLGDSVHENTATSVFSASVLLGALLLVQASVLPAVDALRAMVLSGAGITPGVLLTALGYSLLFYAISLCVAMATLTFAARIYMAATQSVDELAEIRANNVGVALILGAVLLGVAGILREPVQRLNGSLVDYDVTSSSAPPLQVPPRPEIRVQPRTVE